MGTNKVEKHNLTVDHLPFLMVHMVAVGTLGRPLSKRALPIPQPALICIWGHCPV